jgi:D-alanyl-D-alanine dipeptidase
MMFLVVVNSGMACNIREHQPENKLRLPSTAVNIAGKDDIAEDWLEITERDGCILSMPYAGTNNFTRKKIYPCARCLLHPEVGQALISANRKANDIGLKIVIYDAYRPLPYQQKMYDVVQDKRYVADPQKGSMHNRGCAVDVGLADSLNQPLDMGTGFDDFSERAAYAAKGLTEIQRKNRSLLRTIMTSSGFRPYEAEWWHFNYKKSDYPLSDYIWPCK